MPKHYIAHFRHSNHYCTVAAESQRRYLEGGEFMRTGLDLFDQEREQINIGYAWLRQNAGNPDTDMLLLEYTNQTKSIGELRYHLQNERIPQIEDTLLAATRL